MTIDRHPDSVREVRTGMTRRRLYYLTDDGMATLKLSPAFIRLNLGYQETLLEHLQTTLCGMNRLDEKLLRIRLDKVLEIIGSDAGEQVVFAIRNVLCFQKASTLERE